ncbi:hypothetical protein PAMA_016129 [Pampus argenteus]
MCRTPLWLLASLAFASLSSLADGAPLQVMSAPNLLRIGTAENIFVECQDCTGDVIGVEIIVMNHPTKAKRLGSTSVTLTTANNFQSLGQITIPAEDFSKDPKAKQYVYLQAQFPDRLLEKVVLVSFQSGYIFIQTDKTLYTPDSRVMARFNSNPQQSYSSEFEVKEYVLPSFEVKLTPVSTFFYVDSQDFTVNIKATYLFGEEVDGTAYVVFGVVHEGQKKSFPSSLKRVSIVRGVGEVTLKREHITQTFPNIIELVGKHIFVAVSVLTESGSEMVEAELRGIPIVTSPYTIYFKKTPKYFKPGMSFDLAIEVLNPDDTPAQGVPVVVDPGQVQGFTAANGIAKLTINTAAGATSLQITAKTTEPRISSERQASATMVAAPYTTKSSSYIHIGVDTAELELGDNLKINLNLYRPQNQDKDITYLILSRGQLVKHARYRTRGQVLISLIVPITKDMLPSFRIIAYYHTDSNEVVSDSVWMDVKDTCMGSLKLEPSRPTPSYEPHQIFRLKITGDPDATVGVVAVDKGEEDVNFYTDSNEIVSRTKFPESWLWLDIKLPACPPQTPMWLPYSAVRGEQIEIKAILHNYRRDPATVRVHLVEEEDVCSLASKHKKYSQEVKIGPQTTRSVPFIIIPMKEGQHQIEVQASVKDSSLNDGVMKILRVVPEGILVKSLYTVILDPAKTGGKQEEIINSGIPKKDLVPNTPTSTQIYVTGREQVSALVENAVSGQSMSSLIYQPSGNGEQNMIHMTLPVIATTYLDKTNQWETVGYQKRNEALQYIKTGYKNQLAYRAKDGSFSVWADHQSSTWLTAYVAKVFAMANTLVAVQDNMVCEAVKFLILKAQQPDGLFREVGRVIHGEMIGDVRGADSDASMTAFCLIAMQESRTQCGATVNSLPSSIDKAVAYLERHLPSLTNPYAVAMTSYALANERKLNREILYKFASPELTHWLVPKGHVYTLEATAYALLALVKANAFEDARPVVRWFNKQQKVGGGYGSTQATIIVYQAIAEYWSSAQEPEYDLDVDILLPGRSKPRKFNFNRWNHYTTRTSKINEINQDVTVRASGSGEATLTLVSLYYALPKEMESDCQKFNLSVQLLPEEIHEDEKIYKLRIEVLYKDKEHDATMSVLDIGLLTGFTVNTNDLDLLSEGRARTIAKYEMNTVLSERGSLIIYLDKVSHTRPEEITFRVHQKLKVGVLQPAAVSVYEYYEQKHCVKFYHPERRSGELLRLCRYDECTCAEVRCSIQKKTNISNDQLTAKSCESTPINKIDFVYKVKVAEFTDGFSTDIYTMQVLQVIKEGSDDESPQGKLRTFLSYPLCREALDLGKGKTFLIMGTSEDIYRDDPTQSYQYVFSESTWIEYWPTEAECQTEEHRPTCLAMEEMVQ